MNKICIQDKLFTDTTWKSKGRRRLMNRELSFHKDLPANNHPTIIIPSPMSIKGQPRNKLIKICFLT